MIGFIQHVLEWNQFNALGQQLMRHAVHFQKILQILSDRNRKIGNFRTRQSPNVPERPRFSATVKSRLQALGLYNFVRGFGWAYIRGGKGVGGGGGLISGIKNTSKQADNKTHFISLQDQIRNSNLNCNRNITKQG